jgi:4-hydroxy-tetrahydrodipicolinate synthase
MDGVWLPIITPFLDHEVDLPSFERLLDRYLESGISGVIVLGTTGESPTVTTAEREQLLERAQKVLRGRLPLYVGVSGNSTDHVVADVEHLERCDVDGYLVACPYYNRPPQDGLAAHFRAVAAQTERPIVVYNIPYRTGVNRENDTLFELIASCPNIQAVKDSSGNLAQTVDLIARAPAGFSVLTGEDALFFTALVNGADGGILASAHLATPAFVQVAQAVRGNDLVSAQHAWTTEAALWGSLLFLEPNPMPIKYCLWRMGLIRSPECRLPLTRVSEEGSRTLDAALTKVQSLV